MPATNGLQPITYNDAERETIKSYGDWTNFVNSHGHKWDDEGQADAEATLRAYGQERGDSDEEAANGGDQDDDNDNDNREGVSYEGEGEYDKGEQYELEDDGGEYDDEYDGGEYDGGDHHYDNADDYDDGGDGGDDYEAHGDDGEDDEEW